MASIPAASAPGPAEAGDRISAHLGAGVTNVGTQPAPQPDIPADAGVLLRQVPLAPYALLAAAAPCALLAYALVSKRAPYTIHMCSASCALLAAIPAPSSP